MKKVEVKKINEEELKKIQDFEAFFVEANRVIGQLVTEFEFKKSDVLRQISDQYAKREEFKIELSEIYGKDISIDLNSGEISIPEKENV